MRVSSVRGPGFEGMFKVCDDRLKNQKTGTYQVLDGQLKDILYKKPTTLSAVDIRDNSRYFVCECKNDKFFREGLSKIGLKFSYAMIDVWKDLKKVKELKSQDIVKAGRKCFKQIENW